MMLHRRISHTADLDGLASASLMIRKFLKSNEPFMIFLRDYEDESEVIPSALLNISGDCSIYISDISIMLKGFDKILEKISKINGKVLWTDHHEYSKENFERLKELGVELLIDPAAPAAAMLVAKRYNLNDEQSGMIVEMATQADTWKVKEERVMDLVNLIDYYNYLEKRDLQRPRLTALSYILAQYDMENLPSEDMRIIINYYNQAKEKAFEKVLSTSTEIMINGLRLRFALSPNIISGTQAADLLIKSFNADVYVVIKEDGGVSFRRGRDDIDLSKIAVLFGGGGHAYASGASLGIKINDDNFKQIVAEMTRRISESLK